MTLPTKTEFAVQTFSAQSAIRLRGDCSAGCKWEETAWERLAAYEDTGLTPEEVDTLQKDWSYLCTVVGECGGLSRVKELTEADKDGRLVVLPCKVGDTVYKVITIQSQKPVILETQVKTLGQVADVAQLLGKRNKVINIFLTREEAERALEGKQNESM